MRRRTAFLALAFLIACGSTEPADELAGAYDLVAMDGQPLPHVQIVSDVRLTIDQRLLVISPKGEWSLATGGTRQIGAQPAVPMAEIVTGTWSSAGNTLTLLSYNPPDVLTASYSAGTITMDRAVYQRR